MAFTDLTPELQTVLLESHSYLTKWFVFFLIIFLSCYYLFVVWRTHEKTKFFTIVLLRLFLFTLSISYLVASPIILVLMTPEYSFLEFYNLPLKIYSVFMSLVFVFVLIDIFRYGFTGMLRFAGIDVKDPNTNQIIRSIENNKHFMKLGRK